MATNPNKELRGGTPDGVRKAAQSVVRAADRARSAQVRAEKLNRRMDALREIGHQNQTALWAEGEERC